MKSALARSNISQEGNNEGPNGNDDEEETPFPKVNEGEKATENSTINGEESSPSNPIIPTNYYPIDTDTSSWGDGDDEPTPEDVSAGLVITDSIDEHGESNGNEWVWVPVQKNAQGKAISNNGTSDVVIYQENENGVNMFMEVSIFDISTGKSTTVSYGTTKTYKYSTSEIVSGVTRGLPGSNGTREPDLVIGGDGTNSDNGTSTVDSTKKWHQIAGYSSLTEMAEGLRDDYEEMIESIETYGGFYIGRYELSTEGVKKDKTVAIGTIAGTAYNWYQLYADCKLLEASDDVQTRMIWGNLWDVTCNWIASEKDSNNQSVYDITDSRKWGAYSGYNTANGYSNGDEGYVATPGSGNTTGFSEYWKAKNIYDFAGNFVEWTQDAYDHSSRLLRTSNYGDGTGGGPTYKTSGNPTNSNQATTRPVLYVK